MATSKSCIILYSTFYLVTLALLGACASIPIHQPVIAEETRLLMLPDLSPTILVLTQGIQSTEVTPSRTLSISQTPSPGCNSISGNVLTVSIPSIPVKGELKFHLYLPPCYEQDTSQRYPVLYLIHGQSFNDDQWVRLGAPQAADELIAAGMPPFIIVMPFDKYHYRQPATDPFDEAGDRGINSLCRLNLSHHPRAHLARHGRALTRGRLGTAFRVELPRTVWSIWRTFTGHPRRRWAPYQPPAGCNLS